MPGATVLVKHYTGITPVKSAIVNARLSTSDIANPGFLNPIPLPSEGFKLSFWMTLHLYIEAMNEATALTNCKFYTDGAIDWTLGTDGGLFLCRKSSGDNGVPEGNYAQATGVTGVSGNDVDDEAVGHPYYRIGSSNYASPDLAKNATYASPFLVDSGEHTEAGAFKGLVFQLKVALDATKGAKPSEPFTWVYDEI